MGSREDHLRVLRALLARETRWADEESDCTPPSEEWGENTRALRYAVLLAERAIQNVEGSQ